MTVTYTSEVTTSTGIGCFLKLLLRWRGSIYKLIWPDIFLFMIFYYIINLTYRFALDDTQKLIFEQIVRYCEKYGNLIPLSFVLGFYVNLVMTRWWSQYSAIPFPDDLALLVSANVKGDDEHARVVRRTLMRYVCLCFALTLRLISPKVKKRFPTLEHLVEAGLLQKDELNIMYDLDNEYPSYSKYWLPLVWAGNIVTRARHEGMIRDDPAVNNILSEINKFRNKCGILLDYDWISVPLVYTQVVTLAVYTYFMTALLGRQWIEAHNKEDSDLYFPALTILEYFFYMGWLKVAETLINPFGDDDDDFEVVWMIDRHVQVTYLIVDKIHHEHPKLMKDQYWATMAPNQLPYTLASEQFKEEYPILSTNGLIIGGKSAEIVQPENFSSEKVDGSRNSESFISRMFSRNSNQHRTTELNRVIASNTRETSEKISKPEHTSNVINDKDNDLTEFNKLKKLRQKITQHRVLKYLELLKNQTDTEKSKLLVDEVLYTTS